MIRTDTSCPPWVDAAALAEPVARLLGDTSGINGSWKCERLGGFGRGVGTWRLRGRTLRPDRRSWSLVLKGWAATERNADPAAWDWPGREAELYLSGMLAALPPGIRAPRCLDAITRDDGTAWVWLEDLANVAAPLHGIDDHATAAHALGRLNGAYLAGRPLPSARGIGRAWLARWTEAAAPELAQLVSGIDHPRVRAVYPADVVATFATLWKSRHALLNRLDHLPATFCHRDAFSRNIFLRAASKDVFAIDWEFAGIGFPGEDLAPLVAATLLFMDMPMADAPDLEGAATAAYLNGLRSAGWMGDLSHVRAGYALSAALRFGVGMTRMLVPFLMSDERIARWESTQGRSEAETVAQYAAVNRWLCSLVADEAGTEPPRPGDRA